MFHIVVCSIHFVVNITLPPFLSDNETIPEKVWFSINGMSYEDLNYTTTRDKNGTAQLTLLLTDATVDYNVSFVSHMLKVMF